MARVGTGHDAPLAAVPMEYQHLIIALLRRVAPHCPHVVCRNRRDVVKPVVAMIGAIWTGHHIPLRAVPVLNERSGPTSPWIITTNGPNFVGRNGSYAFEAITLGNGEAGSRYDTPLVAIPVLDEGVRASNSILTNSPYVICRNCRRAKQHAVIITWVWAGDLRPTCAVPMQGKRACRAVVVRPNRPRIGG